MVGGVATSKGDFRCTRMVDLCLLAGEDVPDAGENAAVVGGLRSSLDLPGPVSDPRAGDGVISVIQGVSARCQSWLHGKSLIGSSSRPTYQTQPYNPLQPRDIICGGCLVILQDPLMFPLPRATREPSERSCYQRSCFLQEK